MEQNTISSVWPEWRIVRQIGKGSYGTVYEAVRTEATFESHAAIKILTIPQNESEISSLRAEGLSWDATRTYLQGVVDDFVGEIQLMESFKGVQNIVSVEDYKVVDHGDQIRWDIYIRMELLTPFNDYIIDRELSEEEVIKLGVDICSALELCKKRNVIHRDIKPENIFINQFGDFKLGDFGIARTLENATGGLSQKGTYNYMAPEVERGGVYDGRVDIYSLGIVLYRLMNKNRLPFIVSEKQMYSPNERTMALRRRLQGEPLSAPSEASAGLANVILCACAFNPNERFSNPTALKNALLNAKAGIGINGRGRASYDTETDLDRTVRVKRPDGTVRVNPPSSGKQSGTSRDIPNWNDSNRDGNGHSSGHTGQGPKKPIALILGIAVCAVILLTGGILLGSKIFGSDNSSSESTASSDSVAEETKAESAAESVAAESTEEVPVTPEPEMEEAASTWQEAYIEYLNHCDEDVDLDGFMLLDVDGNQIPELLLWYTEHSSMGLVSWYDDKIQENGLGEYCSTVDGVSGITFYPKSNTIYSQYISPSKTGDPELSVLNNGKLQRVDSVKSKKGAVNYTLSDSYKPTNKNYEKKVNAWTPETAYAGTKPVETKTETKKTTTPTPTPTVAPTAAPVTQTILYVADPVQGLNLRDGSDISCNKLLEVHGSVPLTFRGVTEQGYGSDGLIHDWYQVEVGTIYGWVRTDLVSSAGGGYYVPTIQDGMNMRSDHTINSSIAACIYGSTYLEYAGKTGEGVGSDGKVHTWMYVRIADTFYGWMRGDLLTTG